MRTSQIRAAAGVLVWFLPGINQCFFNRFLPFNAVFFPVASHPQPLLYLCQLIEALIQLTLLRVGVESMAFGAAFFSAEIFAQSFTESIRKVPKPSMEGKQSS